MKKLILVLVMVVLAVVFQYNSLTVFAEGETEQNYEEELSDEINKQLESLDLTGMEDLLTDFSTEQYSIFGASSFFEKLQSILNGSYAEGQTSVFSAIINLIFDELLDFLPIVATIIAIAILCGFMNSFKSSDGSKTVGDIVHFVCYAVIISIVVGVVVSLMSMTTNTLTFLKSQMDVFFPILLTILTAMGGVVSVSVYQPAVALLSGSVMQIFTSILMPIFIFTFVFSIISNMSSSVKLDKFCSFFSSLFKWIIGIVFTVFMAFLSIQGITANTYDGVSIRTAKFAIKSYIPLLGGYLSEGFDVILASSVLIKNGIGASGLLLMFASVIMPVLKIVIFTLILKLTSSILEPLADSRISNFIYAVSKTLTMLVVVILGVAFMYLISVGLIMCTFNYV